MHPSAEPKPISATARPSRDMTEYFAGRRLWGDDFTLEEIEEWFRDETTAYFELAAKDRARYNYDYHELNRLHGYRFLPPGRLGNVLCFGGAYGEEVQPIASRCDRITIVDPGAYSNPSIDGTPVEYRSPNMLGTIPAADAEFDLITCLGALHHVPNVSTVIGEFGRCLRPGGFALIREPIVSMGDWRQPRPGLTKRERGIPLSFLIRAIEDAGLEIRRMTRCVFPLTSRIGRTARVSWFNSPLLTRLDYFFSRGCFWPTTYHPTRAYQRVQPSAAFFVGVKPRR